MSDYCSASKDGDHCVCQSVEKNCCWCYLPQEPNDSYEPHTSSNWIPVKEREPKVHQQVLAFIPNGMTDSTKFQLIKWWAGDSAEVSHWQPIEPPK